MKNRVKKAIELEQELNLSEEYSSKAVAMTLVMTDKFLSEKEISEIWRDYKMIKIFKYAEEKGIEKGIEKGREEGRKEGRKEVLERMAIKLLIKKFNGLSKDYKKRLKKLDGEELEIIVDDIVDMEDITDLDKYLN
jgi:flagellar biosynthesis/type III secretory pathway protein FliH